MGIHGGKASLGLTETGKVGQGLSILRDRIDVVPRAVFAQVGVVRRVMECRLEHRGAQRGVGKAF